MAATLFADDHEGKLPSGASENIDPTDEHVPVLSGATRSNLIDYAGNFKMLECPSLGPPFNQSGGWYYAGYGHVIGYNYLGGHTNIPGRPPRRSFRGLRLKQSPMIQCCRW